MRTVAGPCEQGDRSGYRHRAQRRRRPVITVRVTRGIDRRPASSRDASASADGTFPGSLRQCSCARSSSNHLSCRLIRAARIAAPACVADRAPSPAVGRQSPPLRSGSIRSWSTTPFHQGRSPSCAARGAVALDGIAPARTGHTDNQIAAHGPRGSKPDARALGLPQWQANQSVSQRREAGRVAVLGDGK